jgi:ATP-dependent Zn protease
MTDAHNEARRLLTDKRDLLERVTRRLLDIEVMEGDELRAILGVQESASHTLESTEKTPLPPGIH